MRVFVAVWPGPDARAALERLDRPEHPAVRWTTPDQWHITLRFLGEVAEDDVPGHVEALQELGATSAPRAVVLGPATRRVRRNVLVAPVSGLDDLTEHAHLTLARARGKTALPHDLGGLPVEVSWLANEVTLVRSHLEPTGARYETFATAHLAGCQPEGGRTLR